MIIKKPSTLTLESGQQWILINAKKIHGIDFGLVAEVPTEEKSSLLMGVAEMMITEGQAQLAFYEGPDSIELISELLAIPVGV